MLDNIFYSILTAVFLSILGFAKNHPETNESFNYQELGMTILFGAFVGVIVSATGFPITNENFENAFIQYAGLITMVKHATKAIYRTIKKYLNEPLPAKKPND